MKPAVFEYYDPTSLREALELLARLGEDAKVLAGGQSLVPTMNFRLARPANLVPARIERIPNGTIDPNSGPVSEVAGISMHEQRTFRFDAPKNHPRVGRRTRLSAGLAPFAGAGVIEFH